MAYTITDLFSVADEDAFVAKINAAASLVGLTPSSWPEKGMTNSIIKGVANVLGVAANTTAIALAAAGVDGLAATIARAGFLDSAAEITPEGGGGWLDLLAYSVFDQKRNPPTRATGPVTLTNTGPQRGPFAKSTYHLVDNALRKTYSNTTPFTIAAAGDTTTEFEADEEGAASTTIASTLVPATTFVGVSVKTSGGANTNALVGTDGQLNTSFVATCRSKLSALGPKLGPSQAYVYFATTTTVSGYPTTLSGGQITEAVAELDPYSGIVHVYLRNAGGIPSGGDITTMSAYLNRVVVPDGTSAVFEPVVADPLAITLDVYVPAAFAGAAAADVQAAISLYLSSVPLGGIPGSTRGVQVELLEAAIFQKVIYVENIENLLINGSANDHPLASYAFASASPAPVVTVFST